MQKKFMEAFYFYLNIPYPYLVVVSQRFWVVFIISVISASFACTPQIRARDDRAVAVAQNNETAPATPVAFPSALPLPGDTPVVNPSPIATGGADVVVTPAETVTANPQPSANPTVSLSPTPLLTPSSAAVVVVTPPALGTYKLGDSVFVTVRFSTPVIWVGRPLLKLLGASGAVYDFEPYLGFGTAEISFRHVVKGGVLESSFNLATSFEMSATNQLQEKFGGSVVNSIPATTFGGVIIDGRQTRPIAVELPNSGVYSDYIDIKVTYDAPVTLRGFPFLEILVNTTGSGNAPVLRRAFANSVVGNAVIFRYGVLADDFDMADGVVFSKVVLPNYVSSESEAVLGANGNPTIADLSSVSWPSALIRIAPILPAAPLYAHFVVSQSELFTQSADDGFGCNMSSTVPWMAEQAVACWKPKDKSLPFLKVEAGNLIGAVKSPVLKLSGFAPFVRPALSFRPSNGGALTDTFALSFPTNASPLFTENSARFLAVAFSPGDTNAGQLLFSIDAQNRVSISPLTSEVRIRSGSKEGVATVPLSNSRVAILSLADTGSETVVRYWNADSNTVVTSAVQVQPANSVSKNVFNWPLTGMHIGGRYEAADNVFTGGVAELLIYGSLTAEEERRVVCYLATRHGGFTGSCL